MPGHRADRVEKALAAGADAGAADDAVVVRLTRDSPATLRADAGNGAPAADAGADRRAGQGSVVTLDGRGSCDPDGDTLTPRWELTSAPAGSAWTLDGADSWRPRLTADRVGPYRARLTVTDARGAVSTEAEVLVVAGSRGADGVDDDLDGRIDSDDPDLDGPEDAVLVALPADGGPVRGGTAAASSFALTRDGDGRLTALSGQAVLGAAGTTVTVQTARNDRGRWRGWVEVRDDALGEAPVRARLGATATITDVAPGVAHAATTIDGRPLALLVVDG